MCDDWCDLRGLGQERLQRLIAEADAYRLARLAQQGERARRAERAGPSVWQALGAALRRLATRRLPSLATR
jgi:hypothetical protein